MFALRASCCLVGLALAGLPACSGDENSPTGDVNKPTWDGGEDGVAPDSSSPDASDAPGDSEATDASEEGGGGSACGFAPSEVAGSPSPSGQTHVLHEVHGMAQNQLAVDHVLPVFGDPGVLARGACGTVGVLLFDDGAMSYVDLTGAPSDPVVVEPQASGFDASLMYDDACTPWVLRASSGGYVAYHPDDEGVWSSVPIEVNWDALLGVPLTGFSHVWGGRAADGKLHLVASARTSDAAFFVRGSRVATAGGTWSFEVVPTVGAEQIETVRVAPDGKLHALYTRTEYPCDPCNLDLYHGVFDGGAWVEDTVQASVWGPPEDQFATAPSIAFDAAGGAWVVATFQVRAVTGSLISSELRVYGKAGGGWCHERIVADSDGYAGRTGRCSRARSRLSRWMGRGVCTWCSRTRRSGTDRTVGRTTCKGRFATASDRDPSGSS